MEERAQLALEQIRQRLEQGDLDEAGEIIAELHPADGADVLLALNEEQLKDLFTRTSSETAAEMMEHLDPADALRVSEWLQPGRLSGVLDQMEKDKAADLLNELPSETVAELLIDMSSAPEVAPLLLHSPESAGGVMSLEFVTLEEEMTADQAISYLRRYAPSSDQVYYLFVKDKENHLKGVVSLRALIVAQPYQQLAYIMDPSVISVQAGADQEECARIMQHYDLMALPVVDSENRLMGVITLEEAIDVAEEEATEDMYRMVGLPGEERVFSPLRFSVRKRLPWLYMNVATALLAGAVVSLFEDTLSRVAVLAVFMPVVAGLGGNTGIQTLTIVVRGMALEEIAPRQAWRSLGKEVTLGLIHGIAVGSVVGLLAYFWRGEAWLGLVVAVAMVGNMLIAGAAGVLVPTGLKVLGIDPALASGIFLLTLIDICGFFFLLGLATLVVARFL